LGASAWNNAASSSICPRPGDPLALLVKSQLREPVAELVAQLVPQLVAEQLEQLAEANGGSAIAEVTSASVTLRTPVKESPPRRASAGSTMKVCKAGRIEKPIGEYDKSRNVCRPCRSWQQREASARRAAAATAADDTGPLSDTNPRAARLRPVRLLVPLLLILHVDRHELVVGLPREPLQVSSKGVGLGLGSASTRSFASGRGEARARSRSWALSWGRRCSAGVFAL
jgi:hypothetical protein